MIDLTASAAEMYLHFKMQVVANVSVARKNTKVIVVNIIIG